MAVIHYLEVLTKTVPKYPIIPLYYEKDHPLSSLTLTVLVVFSSLAVFSSSILTRKKKKYSLFPSCYFYNLVSTAFFHPRPFSIYFAIEVKLKISYYFYYFDLLFWISY